MKEVFDIKIENLLKVEKREIKVYHHSAAKEVTLGYEASTSKNFGLLPAGGDHLFIEIVGAEALNRNCWVKFASKGNIEFIPGQNRGKKAIENFTPNKGIVMKIPPGPSTWKLKISMPSWLPVPGKPVEDNVTISDDEP